MEDRIFVVGGGPSLEGFDFKALEKERTIAVNASIFDLPQSDYFITMDFSFFHNMENRGKSVCNSTSTNIFVCGLHHPFLIEVGGMIIDDRFKLVYDLKDFDLIIKSRKQHGIGTSFKDFRNGENSGYCALQLAVLLGFKKIYLLGIDLRVTKKTHYHNMYGAQARFGRKLRDYTHEFRQGLPEIKVKTDAEVISCSSISALNDLIEYIPIGEVL